jgi:hypothetical protein
VSLARAYVTFEGVFLLGCGLLVLARARKATLLALGWLWLSYGLYLLSYHWLYVHEWTFLRDYGSYLIFITAMLWIALTGRLRRGRSG